MIGQPVSRLRERRCAWPATYRRDSAWNGTSCRSSRSPPSAGDDGELKGYRALCPAHNDHRHSFSIGVSDDGKVILYQCFACKNRRRERLALINECGISERCLPVPAREAKDLVDYLSGCSPHQLTTTPRSDSGPWRRWRATMICREGRSWSASPGSPQFRQPPPTATSGAGLPSTPIRPPLTPLPLSLSSPAGQRDTKTPMAGATPMAGVIDPLRKLQRLEFSEPNKNTETSSMSEIPEEIRERLEAAERVCVLFGWTASTGTGDRDKALHELWSEWVDLVGSASTGPDAHPELSEERITGALRVGVTVSVRRPWRVSVAADSGGAAPGDWSEYAMATPPATTPDCEPHTPSPPGYLAHAEWMEEMGETHKVRRCRGCRGS